jgi:hypothetical protein
LRLEKGDTIDKMLADIDVPDADRKQIDQALQAILKKRRIAVGEEIAARDPDLPGQTDAPRVLSLSVRPQPEREFIVKRRTTAATAARRRPIASARASCGSRASGHGSLQSSGIAGGGAIAGDGRVHPRARLRRRLPARAARRA